MMLPPFEVKGRFRMLSYFAALTQRKPMWAAVLSGSPFPYQVFASIAEESLELRVH
jgi:hypothetical protein